MFASATLAPNFEVCLEKKATKISTKTGILYTPLNCCTTAYNPLGNNEMTGASPTTIAPMTTVAI